MTTNVERELVNMLASEMANDVDWVFMNTIWRWHDDTPGWKRWVANRWPFRCRSMWLGRRLGLGEWWCPPRPTRGNA